MSCRGKEKARAPQRPWLWGPMVLLALSLVVCASAGRQAALAAERPAGEPRARIAVFPVENLTGKAAPLGEIRALLIERLGRYGIGVLDDGTLDRVFTKGRIRYTAGVDRGIAKALGEDTGAEGILIPTLELFEETNPPKVALFCRMVSTGDDPRVVWIDGTGMAGDDSPGILDLRLVENPWVLLTQAVESLARSLAQARPGHGVSPGGESPARKFFPKIVYRSEVVDPAKTYSVAAVPFFNKSERKYAGEIVALHMIRNLSTFQNLAVVEPGVVREELLRYRIIMSDGISLPQTETILNAVDADLVLNGEVLEYQDYPGSVGNAKVDFSVLFLERRTGKVVYSSYSQNQSSDGVVLFDWGRVNTAHAMAAQMVRAIGERMLAQGARAQVRKGPTGQRGTTPR